MSPEPDKFRPSARSSDSAYGQEEFINEYDADENKAGLHSKVIPAPAQETRTKNSFLTALGKIMSFLHR